MLATEQERMREDITALAGRLGRERANLIPVLQAVQSKYSRISDFAMQVTADVFGIHPAEVYGVVSFYSFLEEKPLGKFAIRLCRTISCDMQGKEKVARQLENDLGISFGQTTPDGRFTLEWANCLGMCDQGPALLVNDRVYTRVTAASAHEIIKGCRKAFGVYALEDKKEETR